MRASSLSSAFARRLACAALAVALWCGLSASHLAAAPRALVANPGFTLDENGDEWPDGWSKGPGLAWHSEPWPGLSFVRLQTVEPGKSVFLFRAMPLPSSSRVLGYVVKARASDVVAGDQPWHDARILFEFRNATDAKVGPAPAPLIVSRGGTQDWKTFDGRLVVPEGATQLVVLAALFHCRAGSLDAGLIEVFEHDEVAVGATPSVVPSVAQTGGAARLAPVIEPALKENWPPALRVSGNRLVTDGGEAVRLQGVNIVSLEWNPRGERVREAALRAMEEWRANTLRLPVVESYWFGRDPSQRGDAADYRARVDEIVRLAANRGVYVVLDLHRFRAPRDEHVEFWREAARRYAGHPAVLFDLFNEPHSISWKVWRDGGLVAEKDGTSDEDVFLNAEEALRNKQAFRSPGMQALLDAVREAGADNVVIAGGLDWSYDLSGVIAGYALQEPEGGAGRGIMYSTHIYNWKRDWQRNVLDVAAAHPVFVGEVGATTKIMKFVAEELQESPYTWVPNALGMMERHGLHWTGFSLHPRAAPVMIEDWSFAPTDYWGAFALRALRGERFEMTGLR